MIALPIAVTAVLLLVLWWDIVEHQMPPRIASVFFVLCALPVWAAYFLLRL